MSRSVLSVAYTGEPDVWHELAKDGDRLVFGRGDDCDIVIWTAINGRELSRVAGAIWRMDGELWLRNLSTRHDLYVQMLGRPPEQPLPPREADGVDRGPARSIPGARTYIRGPAGCELVVRQVRAPATPWPGPGGGDDTVHLPPVPQELRAVAAALCRPLLAGKELPASYAEIAATVGDVSLKRVRTQVAELCTRYAAAVPTLRAQVQARWERELDELDLRADPRLRRGIWTYDSAAPDDEETDRARRRSLALPDYFEVAHLLVRHRLVAGAEA